MRTLLTTVFGICLALMSVPPHAAAEVLITDAEARLPSSPDAAMTMRGLTRGPGIEQVSPTADAK